MFSIAIYPRSFFFFSSLLNQHQEYQEYHEYSKDDSPTDFQAQLLLFSVSVFFKDMLDCQVVIRKTKVLQYSEIGLKKVNME